MASASHRSSVPATICKGIGALAALGAAAYSARWLWRHQADIAVRRPINEWTFTHMNWVLATDTVARSDSPSRWPTTPRPLDAEITYQYNGSRTLADLHQNTHTTSFVVIHRGRLIHESYPGRFSHGHTRHQLFSLTKSVTSVLVGIALAKGVIRHVDTPVAQIIPALTGSAFDGPTIAHLLDMTSGVGDLEDWTNPEALITRFQYAVTNGHRVLEVLRSEPKKAEPGTVFNYSTVDTHVLGLALEAATGKSLAALAHQWLWQPLGAEHDAYYFLTREKERSALGGGSLNATARDLARVGQLMVNGGTWNDTQLVPGDWVQRSRDAADPKLAVGALGEGAYSHYGYSHQWWTLGGRDRPFTGLGVHGQYLWVDPEAQVVIVKTSAWDTADDEARDHETIAACRAIVEHLST